MSRFKGSFKGAYKLYQEFVNLMAEDIAYNDGNSGAKMEQKRSDIHVIVYDILVNDSSTDWCKHHEFKQSIEDCKRRGDFRPEKASKAFNHVEHYILLILLMPWKQEYTKIKVSSIGLAINKGNFISMSIGLAISIYR